MKKFRKAFATLVVAGVAICVVPVVPAAAQDAGLSATGILGPGSKIPFTGDREGREEPDEIYVMSADGGGERRVTPTTHECNALRPRCHFAGIDAVPSFSPDGHWILFHRQLFSIPGLQAPNDSDLFAVAVDGSQEVQLTEQAPGSFSAFASWAPGHDAATQAR